MKVTQAELAKQFGKSRAAISKQLKRHGVIPDKSGKVSKTDAIEAIAAGASLDKSKASQELKQIQQFGNTESLVVKGKMATLRRIILQGDLLEIERDKARGDLIQLDNYKSGLLEMQNVCIRLWDIWIDAIGAKRKDADLIEELRKGRDQVLQECGAILEDRTK